MTAEAETATASVPPALTAFTAARGRPAAFVILHEAIRRPHLLALRDELADRRFAELDFVIHSGGGDINIAYQIVQLVCQHADRMRACIPLYAKSAATLWCLAAHEIVMDESAELGPLDTQILERKRGGRIEYVSALNPFKTLEQLRDFSLETLDFATRLIARRSGLDVHESLDHAIRFVQATTGSIFAKLNPEKLGAYSRALEIGFEYGNRLLSRSTDWDRNRRTEVLAKLVRGYPTHDHIIDYPEMQKMGFPVVKFPDAQRESLGILLDWILNGHTAVTLVAPVNGAHGHRREEASPSTS